MPWDLDFENGVNFANADCNGSGKVDFVDFVTISQNYNLTHGDVKLDAIEKGNESDPVSYIDLSDIDTWKNGMEVSIPIVLGESSLPIDQLYGLYYSIVYPEGLFKNNLEINSQEYSICRWNGGFI